MKKGRCRLISVIVIAIMLLNIMIAGIPVSAATTAGEGMTFSADTKFVATKKATAVPKTFEATICVPTNILGINDYSGVLIGSYSAADQQGIIMDIARGGPRVYIRANGKDAGVIFVEELVPYAGQKVHIAITIDPSTTDTTDGVTTLYINGVKIKEAENGNDWYDYEYGTDGARKQNFFTAYNSLVAANLPYQTVGGDLRVSNSRYFKGTLYSAATFSDVRNAAEVAADAKGMPNNDSALLSWYEVDTLTTAGGLVDKSGNGYDLKCDSKWFKNKAPYTDYAYSFAVVGDTQVITRDEAAVYKDPETKEPNLTYSAAYEGDFSKIYDYILENKDEKNIQFSFHMGDVTDWSQKAEWELAMENIQRMDGEIPYNIIRGNHDTSKSFIDNYTMDIFKSNIVDGEEYGTFDGNTLNTYQTITVGDVKYLMLTLDLGAGRAMLAWANKVVKAHPYHNVIVSTHSYLRPDGSYVDYLGDPNNEDDCSASNYNPGRIFGGTEHGGKYNYDYRLDKYKNGGDLYLYQDASYMWENFIKKHKNIVMVLCGHEISDYILKVDGVGDHGNKIVQLLINPQGLDRDLQGAGQGHAGLVAMLYFSEDGKTVSTEYYSTIRDEYYMTDNCYTFELNVVKEPAANGDDDTDPPESDDVTDTPLDEESDEEVEEGGCGSTMSVSAIALGAVLVLGGTVAFNKKRK